MRIAVFLAAALLAGCGSERVETAPEEAVESEQTEEVSQGPARLLLTEEALAYMYRDGRPNGFDFGGVEEDGAFFYEFTRPEEPDFSLRISDDGETAIVRYHGQMMTLNDRTAPSGFLLEWHISAGYGGAVSGYGMPFWVDMTGDGQPDLLYLQGGGGTGLHTDWCVAYDMATMAEIPIVEPWEEMAASISVEPLEWENGGIFCRVTDRDGQVYSGFQPAEEESWQECAYVPGKSGHTTIEILAETAELQVTMAFGLECPHIYGAYMGELKTMMAYDAEEKAIVRSGPITVSMHSDGEE